MDGTTSTDDLRSAEAAILAMAGPSASPAEAAAALEVIGRANLSVRRRLQADLLLGRLSELAALAGACGWQGSAVIRGGHAFVDYDGALLAAEPGHFRASGDSPAALLISTLERFAVRPRVILDLQAGAGEAAILLARRYPRCRVIAVEPSRERLEAFDANLAMQAEPLGNLEIAPPVLGGGPQAALRTVIERRPFDRIDLIRCQAGADSADLAGFLRARRGRIAVACVTLSGPASQHGEMLDALEAAGLVLLEKRSQPVRDSRDWLDRHLSQRGSAVCWFVAPSRLAHLERQGLRGGGRSQPTAWARIRAWAYGLLDRARRRLDPSDMRFEFEKLYALKPDPWNYRTNPYEALKYQRTIQTALRLRPEARTVLEAACSIGVFTRMLARTFQEVTASDVAAEALRLARRQVAGTGRVTYVRSDIRRLDTGRRHDVIFCAEMLYYLPDEAAPEVMRTLERNLAPGGIVITVMPHPFGAGAPDPFTRWHGYLTDGGFRLISEEDVQDLARAYFIRAYSRGDAPA